MKKISLLLLMPFVFGCATIINGNKQKILISSTPASAQVMVDGKAQGQTPVKVDLKRKQTHSVIISHEGYQTQEVQLQRKVSGWVWGNIGFGGLIGLGIDAGTGSMYKLKPETVNIDLKKADGSSAALTTSTTSPTESTSTTAAAPETPAAPAIPTSTADLPEWKKSLPSQSVYGVVYQSGDHAALTVAKGFLEKLKQDHLLGNYQVLDYIYQSDDLKYLKSGFNQGLIFDFKNVKDQVRVRTIQFPEGQVLWETTCASAEACAQAFAGLVK